MSSKKTQNYRLHSWEPGDDFLRAEFNENFGKLDEAVHGLVVTGSYTGDGADSQAIALGFRPRAVLVRAVNGAASDNYRTYSGLAVEGQDAVNEEGTPIVKLMATGFQVHYSSRESSGFLAPRVNSKGSKYSFVAVR